MKKGFIAFVVVDCLLLVLFFLAGTADLLLKEEAVEVRQVSVVTDTVVSGSADTITAGINQAAVEHNIDFNTVNLSALSTEEQVSSIQREADNGAEGFIFLLQDEAMQNGLLEAVPSSLPVVVIGTDSVYPLVRLVIGETREVRAQILADGIIEGRANGETVTLISLENTPDTVTMVHECLREKLNDAGILVRESRLSSFSEAATLAKGLSAQGGNILVSAELSLLEVLAENCGEAPLYGVGWSPSLRPYLEAGGIDGLLVERGFESGYFATKGMAELLKSAGVSRKTMSMDNIVITQENMYEEETESFIFPYT